MDQSPSEVGVSEPTASEGSNERERGTSLKRKHNDAVSMPAISALADLYGFKKRAVGCSSAAGPAALRAVQLPPSMQPVAPCSRETFEKWMIFTDCNSSLSDIQFQLLVAVQASTQASPTVVKRALVKLAAHLQGGRITAKSLAKVEHESLKKLLCEVDKLFVECKHILSRYSINEFSCDVIYLQVHYNQQKAKHIHEGAVLAVNRYHCQIPSRKRQLVEFPGIGSELGELLESLFARLEVDGSLPQWMQTTAFGPDVGLLET